ncbi:hypothetical protein [Psychromicrobium silvestre]|nr:hypothetical protein [Psychromicrobium silvestre]
MTGLNGAAVDYSNGGYIKEVRPEYGGTGIFEINHWYQTTTPTGPLVASQPTSVNWRIPISTDAPITGAQLTFTIPRGTNFALTSGANIAAWGTPYSNYTWTNPTITHTVSPDGLTWTVTLGDLAAHTGVVVQFSGTVPAGTVLSENSVATGQLIGAFPPGTGTCASTPNSTSGNNSAACKVSWVTDATSTVTDGSKGIPDVTRSQVVQPSFGDPGKFGIDGWATASSTPGDATLNGRFVLATDEAISQVTWVLHLDAAINAPVFTVSNPAPGWRVDNNYPVAVTIDAGLWDPAAHTMTYQLTMPAKSSVVINYTGSAEGSYVSGASYTNTANLSGTYQPGSASCAAETSTPTTSTPTTSTPTSSTSAVDTPTSSTAPATTGTLAPVQSDPVSPTSTPVEGLANTGSNGTTSYLAFAALTLIIGVALLALNKTSRRGRHQN